MYIYIYIYRLTTETVLFCVCVCCRYSHPQKLREVDALRKLVHDNIVAYEDHWIVEETTKDWLEYGSKYCR